VFCSFFAFQATLGECGATSTTKILLLATDRAAIDEMHEKERIEAQRREEERIKQVEAQREVRHYAFHQALVVLVEVILTISIT
jgi:hypothetical protein